MKRVLLDMPYNVRQNSEIIGMFSKATYEQVAEIIRTKRGQIEAAKSEIEYDAQNEVLNDMVAGFIRAFKHDNKRFNELLFIAACGLNPDDFRDGTK